jgi:glycosyltransferase involved in cell wall biosynthesis
MECTIGGTRRHLADLVHGLLARGVDVEVACAARRDPRMRDDMASMAAAGARVHELPMVRRIHPALDALHLARLAALICDRRFDVVHTHSSKAGALGRAAALLCSAAARVHTPHTFALSFRGGTGQGGETVGPLGLVTATERLLGRLTHRVIHVSGSEREEGAALGLVPPSRAVVIPNGIDPRRYARPAGGAALRAELGIPDGARVVGSVGLLNDAKGFDLLVAAAPALPVDVHVLIAGHGERERPLREQARALGVADRVHLPGWRDDLSAVHDATDVFALPSRWEGLPYALLEALAAGLPCVASDVNGSRDVLRGDPGCGLLVAPGDPGALASGLRGMLDDAALAARCAEAGPRRVAAAYSLDRMLDRTLALYRELVGARAAVGEAAAAIGADHGARAGDASGAPAGDGAPAGNGR